MDALSLSTTYQYTHYPFTMVLKLYTFAGSAYGNRVIMVLNEKSIPFELNEIEFGEHRTPELLEKQPFGKAPYIVSNFELTFSPFTHLRHTYRMTMDSSSMNRGLSAATSKPNTPERVSNSLLAPKI